MDLPALRAALLTWFDRHKRDLPWRRTRDPYAIWLSEVMLQQTQVVTVIPYWQRFLERFPTVEALAAAPLPDVFALWSGLGYYSRARNLHKAAQDIVTRFGGKLPSSSEALRTLPGFGPYTAGAVASIAFDQEAPLVDGNVARVFSRVFEIEGPPGDRKRETALWDRAAQLVRGPRPGELNQALMELGAMVCRVDGPSCLLCPVREHCAALGSGRVGELPPPRVRAARQQLRLAVAVWRRGDAFLLARRAEGGLFGGLWELPSAEVKPELADAALGKSLRTLLGRAVSARGVLGRVKRTLTHRDLVLDLVQVEGRGEPAAHASVQEWRWATPAEARKLGMSTAMSRALALASDVSEAAPVLVPKRLRPSARQ